MSIEYKKSLSEDFKKGLWPSNLVDKINESKNITPACTYIENVEDVVSIFFEEALSEEEKTAMDVIIAAHASDQDISKVLTLTASDEVITTDGTASELKDMTLTLSKGKYIIMASGYAKSSLSGYEVTFSLKCGENKVSSAMASVSSNIKSSWSINTEIEIDATSLVSIVWSAPGDIIYEVYCYDRRLSATII